MSSHTSHTAGGTGMDAEEEEEDEDSSSSLRSCDATSRGASPAVTLDRFREEWRSEIDSRKQPRMEAPAVVNSEQQAYEIAKRFFLDGVEAERKGAMFEAIQHYRRSIQLVPDIEKKIFQSMKGWDRSRMSSPVPPNLSEAADEANQEQSGVLTQMMERVSIDPKKSICLTDSPVRQKMHISKLPAEVFDHILRCVASTELDMRSLEVVSQVCAGFYVAVRRSKVWEDACSFIWGHRVGPLDGFISWREMFIKRSHLWFHGVYISRMSYIRHGESSFQDQFYRPWHMITYYRYLRFFADGTVLMFTTPEEPASVIPLLRNRVPKHPAILTGSYRLTGEKMITGVLLKNKTSKMTKNLFSSHRNSRERQVYLNKQEHVFMIDLMIDTYRGRLHNQLKWINYEIISRTLQAGETRTHFDLDDHKFPSFYFSRVKSYASSSVNPFELKQ